jgi:hypothetical protein
MESILSEQTSSGELHADESVTFKHLTGDPNDSADRLPARVVVYSGAGRAVAAPAAEDSDGQMKPETLSFDLTHASRNDLRRSSSSSPTMTWGAREKSNKIRPSDSCFSTRGSDPLDLLQVPRVDHEPEGLPSLRAFRRLLRPSMRVHCDKNVGLNKWTFLMDGESSGIIYDMSLVQISSSMCQRSIIDGKTEN